VRRNSMTYKTYSDLIRPQSAVMGRLYDLLLMAVGVVAITFSAYIRIPLPFSPVPLTGQTLTVLLIGILYGRKRGAICVLAYVMTGIAGLPVFQGGHFGLDYIIKGATAGYLFGFIVAAFATGYLAEHGFDRSFWKVFTAMFLGDIILLSFGSLWLAALGTNDVLLKGFIPFIPGDIVKILAATAILPTGWKLIGKIHK
ncbi:MAG: biotin transporter BioY, partial [Spirochaetia bacterium]